uniref:F-box domain-containing protein n=1 Tax=viral metagenome TaxID=1070528 RepID=A0A6C0CA02_9ZZZZ
MNNSDIIYQIFDQLDLDDIVRCSTINKLINRIHGLQYAILINDNANILINLFNKNLYRQIYMVAIMSGVSILEHYLYIDSTK